MKYAAEVRCPYCGLASRQEVGHELELVSCAECQRKYVVHATVTVNPVVRRIEGEATRWSDRRLYEVAA